MATPDDNNEYTTEELQERDDLLSTIAKLEGEAE